MSDGAASAADQTARRRRQINDHYTLCAIFDALGNPVRWTIVTGVAAAGELSYKELEQLLGMPRPSVSYHLKALIGTGLLRVRKASHDKFYDIKTDVITAVIRELTALTPATTRAAVIENAPASRTFADADWRPTW